MPNPHQAATHHVGANAVYGRSDMLLMIDNYDSFTYNLVQYLGELGERVAVYRNDQITLNDIDALSPSHIVISPGPCTPNEAGISVELVREYGPRIPILGVCLGHQSICLLYTSPSPRDS